MKSKCPVCHGTGRVNEDFYNTPQSIPVWKVQSDKQVTCKSCDGKGVV